MSKFNIPPQTQPYSNRDSDEDTPGSESQCAIRIKGPIRDQGFLSYTLGVVAILQLQSLFQL